MNNFEKQLEDYKKETHIEPREEKIQETIQKSKGAFFRAEEEKTLSYYEFVLGQFRLIRKRWWFFQIVLLVFLWLILISVKDDAYVQRSLGIIASLFVILIIPELWKNRTCQSMEIESSAYFSLRQIYATRMLLFGLADILFLSVFMGISISVLHFNMLDLLIQFLFPMTITACICFHTLCCKRLNETAAVALCIAWSSVWLFIVLNDSVYTRITIPIWIFLSALSVIYLGAVIYQTLKMSTNYWEVSVHGIEIN